MDAFQGVAKNAIKYDSLPVGHKLWVCPQCNDLMALRQLICSFEAKVAGPREGETSREETFRNVKEVSLLGLDNSTTDIEN